MDGKPQRPLLNPVRGGFGGFDENAIKPELQNQKSNGALSMAAFGGGLRAAAKRTAFQDRSNTAKNVPVGQYGSVLDIKGYDVKKLDTAASSLARHSVPVLSELFSAHQPQPMKVQPAAPKRTNTIFKDAENGEGLSSFDFKNFPAFNNGKYADQSHAFEAMSNDTPPSSGESSAGERIAGMVGGNSRGAEQYRVADLYRETEQKAHVHESYLNTINAPKTGSDCTSETAADWEHEEDEGYTTAYSFRSRDNTTGHITAALYPKLTAEVHQELEYAAELVEMNKDVDEDAEEAWDITMVAEYSEEIFQHLRNTEVEYLPHFNYMSKQSEIQWSMRAVLLDWMVQVHGRFGLLPETLFLMVNCVDRFLEVKAVSLGKLQLVGITALYCAAKYEEVNCPAVADLQYMVENGYSKYEILKAERYMLGMLDFKLGAPGPLSFLRRISKADEYDLMTRTVAKYFIELTIMDERFISLPPSFIAAGGHAAARLILKKPDWTPHHVHYSGYTFKQVLPLICLLFSCCENASQHHTSIFHKYADKRYKRASLTVLSELSKGVEIPGQRGRFFAYNQLYLQDPPNYPRDRYVYQPM